MNFRERVIQAVRQVPEGQVATYGQIATLADSPRGGRIVGGILAALGTDTDIPWWRVINREGYLSIRGHMPGIKDLQKQLLEKESIEVTEDYHVDLKTFLWRNESAYPTN